MVLINPMQTIFHPWIFQEFKVETDLKLRMKLVQTCHMTSLHCETSFVHCKLVFYVLMKATLIRKRIKVLTNIERKKSENTVKIHFSHMVKIHMTSIRNATIKAIFFLFTLFCTQTKPNGLTGPIAKIQLRIYPIRKEEQIEEMLLWLLPRSSIMGWEVADWVAGESFPFMAFVCPPDQLFTQVERISYVLLVFELYFTFI